MPGKPNGTPRSGRTPKQEKPSLVEPVGEVWHEDEEVDEFLAWRRQCRPESRSMTESQWLACLDLRKMVDFIQTRTTHRKLRLFAVACCRRLWHLMTDPRCQQAVDVAERIAESRASDEEIERATTDVRSANWSAEGTTLAIKYGYESDANSDAAWATYHVTHAALSVLVGDDCDVADGTADDMASAVDQLFQSPEVTAIERAAQCELFRHFVGDPFKPMTIPAPVSSAALRLAEALEVGVDCAFALHDALLEAGHSELAEHFREAKHPRGCWALDLILGKS